jgi:hypothetical protein
MWVLALILLTVGISSAPIPLSGSIFLYGSSVTVRFSEPMRFNSSLQPISATFLAPAFLSSANVTVALNSSLVHFWSDSLLTIELNSVEFRQLAAHLLAPFVPFIPLNLTYGLPSISVALANYCLLLPLHLIIPSLFEQNRLSDIHLVLTHVNSIIVR